MQGISAGADHATHTFNAMRPLDHREPGILGAVLTDDRLTADLIADGIHVDPSIVKLFLTAKGEERAILITDAISATGMGDGRYKLGNLEVEVKGDRCEYNGRLAGSVLTLDRAVRNIMSFAGWKLQQSVRLATLNPARLLGISDRKGVVKHGSDADLVILTPEGKIVQTFIAGNPVPNLQAWKSESGSGYSDDPLTR
jgi:N-acetylglucosamine-6-phosphate deacetylase